MKRKIILISGMLVSVFMLSSFDKSHKDSKNLDKPKNIIFLIGDGMGLTQVYAGMTRNHGSLNLERVSHVGLQKTYSFSSYITDSAASGTAMATGTKTKNGTIGLDTLGNKLKTILEYAEDNGLATGLVSTSSITHATPASFIAHVPARGMYEAIAKDFLNTDIDVFIGGGRNNFMKRKDSLNLVDDLKSKGYTVLFDMDEIKKVKKGKLAGLTADSHNPSMLDGRGDMLPVATTTALNILKKDKDGFFLMVEGSQIDWGCHKNNTEFVITEVLDFDKAIEKALDFAKKNKNTLVVITADHETGGMAIIGGDIKEGRVDGAFSTKGHSSVMVPVYAYGPGAELFTGIYENTEIFEKFMKLYGFSK